MAMWRMKLGRVIMRNKCGVRVGEVEEWDNKPERDTTSLGDNLMGRLGCKKGFAQLVHISLQNMKGNPKLLNINAFQLSINTCKIYA